MNKKEISEIKKQFTPENCSITRICGCYVDGEKNKKTELKEAFLSLSDAEKNEDPIAKKVSEYAELMNKDLSESIEALPTGLEYDETTIECYKAEGRDLVHVMSFDPSVASKWTQEVWEEYARTDDLYNNTLFKNLTETVGDDSVRLIIRFVDNDDNVLYDHIIDKNYKSSAGTITIIDDTDEAEYAVKAAAKYCSENAERLNAELSMFMEEDAKWNGCHAEESDIVFEFKYNKAHT